jgi:uncharacterized protein (TIGR02246 family)
MRRLIRNKMIFIALAALAAFASHSAAAQPAFATDARADDDAAIRENVRQLEAGWNSRSGALFAKPFAEDADYVVINGMHIRGREAIDKGHQRIFDTIFKNTTLSLSVRQTRYLRPDVAVVHVSGRLKSPQDEGEAAIVLVMSKEKNGWEIVAFQNTQVEGAR